MINEISDDFLTFRDEEHIPAQVIAGIRQGLTKQNYIELPEMPAFSPTTTMPNNLPQAIANHLAEANRLMQSGDVTPILAPSPASQLPVLGRLWSLIREQAHQLPLYYIHRQSANIVQANSHLSAAINELAVLYTTQQATITALQTQVNELQGQIKE